VRPNGFTTVHVESAVALSEAQALCSTSRRPIHHILDDDIRDFAFGFEHFEHFIAEQFF
jgi:hypothetical protein